MPRRLDDVLEYLLPEAAGAATAGALASEGAPVVCVPIGARDVVRGALAWNLGIEAARQGAAVAIVAPSDATWAGSESRDATTGPLGVRIVRVAGGEPRELAEVAEREGAEAAARGGTRGAFALAGVPGEWLAKGADAGALVRHVVVLVRPDEVGGPEGFGALEAATLQDRDARIGACVFGARSLAAARDAFEALAAAAELQLGRTLLSYGVLIDDVELSRSIVSGRPIGLARPHSAAARALADVASLLVDDLRPAGVARA